MEEINKKQREFWSGSGGDVWVDKQRERDIMLNPLGKNAINKRLINEEAIIESLMCFKRAGGSAIVSYFALDIAKKIKS